MTVTPGTSSSPDITATTRAMLKPCSAAGWPQPSIRSSMSSGFTSGTWASAASTAIVARSSPRIDTSDPLPARPIGVRAMAATTASSDTRISFVDVGGVGA